MSAGFPTAQILPQLNPFIKMIFLKSKNYIATAPIWHFLGFLLPYRKVQVQTYLHDLQDSAQRPASLTCISTPRPCSDLSSSPT